MSTYNHNTNNGNNTAISPLAGFFDSVVGQIGQMINGR
jgi:hypothetical protein